MTILPKSNNVQVNLENGNQFTGLLSGNEANPNREWFELEHLAMTVETVAQVGYAAELGMLATHLKYANLRSTGGDEDVRLDKEYAEINKLKDAAASAWSRVCGLSINQRRALYDVPFPRYDVPSPCDDVPFPCDDIPTPDDIPTLPCIEEPKYPLPLPLPSLENCIATLRQSNGIDSTSPTQLQEQLLRTGRGSARGPISRL